MSIHFNKLSPYISNLPTLISQATCFGILIFFGCFWSQTDVGRVLSADFSGKPGALQWSERRVLLSRQDVFRIRQRGKLQVDINSTYSPAGQICVSSHHSINIKITLLSTTYFGKKNWKLSQNYLKRIFTCLRKHNHSTYSHGHIYVSSHHTINITLSNITSLK